MSEKVTFLMKITKQPKCIDRQNDLWVFYCPFDKKWCKGTRHGYTSEFWSEMYFECEDGHKIEAPGWWK